MEDEPSTKKVRLDVTDTSADEVVKTVEINEDKDENCETICAQENAEKMEEDSNGDVEIIKVENSSENDQSDFKNAERYSRNPEDVGMTEFLGQHRGFFGTLKNRWEDFHVHEIAMNGEIVRLTSVDLPESEKDEIVVDSTLLSDEVKDNLNRLVKGELEVYRIPAPDDKEERTQLHKAIKREFPDLNSNTVNDGDTKEIKITHNKRATDQHRSKDPSRICQFVLHKKGRDTAQAISIICGLLKSHPRKLTFSGNKDKRGVSSQLVTGYQISLQRLKSLNPSLREMKVGNFKYVKKQLQLGDLKGNHFSIAIRDVIGEEEDISTAMKSLMENGFINYFGLQRFGSGNIPTYDVGLSIIRSQWEKAIELILEPQTSDLPVVRDLKRKYKSDRDPKEALKGMSDHVSRGLLHGICRHGRTMKALMEMPRQLRQLYIHSTQSLMWNRLASRRVREFGARVQPGDLIIREECRDNRLKTKNAVVEVTEENMKKVSIYDLVIPLPGYDVTFGTGKIRQWYLELLLELDLTEDQFKHEIKDFSAAGTYRAVFVRPTDLTFYTRMYDDHMESVISSDWDLLTCSPTVSKPSITGSHKAVVINFSLPKSSYATVAIHELMRTVKVKK